MKAIMTLIVTLSLATYSLQASNPPVISEFTVTQLALEAAQKDDVAMQELLNEIADDTNESKENNSQKGAYKESN